MKKGVWKILTMALVLGIALSLAACDGDNVDNSPSVESIIINPATAAVERGATQDFTATVLGTNNPSQSVVWNVITWAEPGTGISADGRLTIDNNEPTMGGWNNTIPRQITVRATSTVNNNVWREATVTVTSPVTSITVNPQTVAVVRGNTYDFTATVSGHDTPPQTVAWTVENGNPNIFDSALRVGTRISANGRLTVDSTESTMVGFSNSRTPRLITVRATSTVDDSVSGTATVTVVIPEAWFVTIVPQDAAVRAGGTLDFTATVEGTHDPPQAVTWEVLGWQQQLRPGTWISANGQLTVADDEPVGQKIDVRAISTFNSSVQDWATVTVVP